MESPKFEKLPITIDPEILGGTPVFKGTRVPVKTFFDYLRWGYSLEEFFDFFPSVTREVAMHILSESEQAILQKAARQIASETELATLQKVAA
ncbi:MAG: DUF433 domain-containing protein [Acidobacteria bacterium]|nr:DUF433 domain-containing protein [Acidobacteriota bacterium]